VLKSTKPIVLKLDIHPNPSREYHKRDKDQDYCLREREYTEMFGMMYTIGRMHDRVVGISLIGSAIPFIEEYISGDMSNLQIIKINGNISDYNAPLLEYDDGWGYQDEESETQDIRCADKLFLLMERNAATLEILEFQCIRFNSYCSPEFRVECHLPKLKEVRFVNCVGKPGFVDRIFKNAPALKKKIVVTKEED